MVCVFGYGFWPLRRHSWTRFTVFVFGYGFWPLPRQSWLGFVVCACLGTGCALTPPFLAGVCGVRVCVPVLPLPRQPWLGFVLCVFVWGFCLHPAIPGWGLRCVFECGFCFPPANPCWRLWYVCLGAGFAFAPPLIAGVRGVCCWLCWGGPSPMAEVPVRTVPRQSWLGPAASCHGVVPRESSLRSLWVLFPANHEPGLAGKCTHRDLS